MTDEIKKNVKGRAAISNRNHRYQPHTHQQQADDWFSGTSADKVATEVTFDNSGTYPQSNPGMSSGTTQ